LENRTDQQLAAELSAAGRALRTSGRPVPGTCSTRVPVHYDSEVLKRPLDERNPDDRENIQAIAENLLIVSRVLHMRLTVEAEKKKVQRAIVRVLAHLNGSE
jgi:hypothetical protein